MQFLLYSAITEDSIVSHFGASEYSYFFVLNGFQEVLAELGAVTIIHSPHQEVDAIYETCRERGEDCVFLSFSPPHKAPVDLKCPTVTVFAWEFSNIPTETWDEDPRNDWRYVFARHGRTIALSSYTANAVRQAMGDDFPVAAIPVPLWDRYSVAGRVSPSNEHVREIKVVGTVLDSRFFDFSRFRRQSEIADTCPPLAPVTGSIHLDGIVFTSIFNPSDGRKNWIDLVTGFVHAFRDVADATLILKMTNNDIWTFVGPLFSLFSQLSPFKCRIIAMNGFYDLNDYGKLISATHIYVNVSHCEGLCMPLMEFMSCGKPAISPRHTAMEDYIDDSVAFIPHVSLERSTWPQDPRDLVRTLRYRLDWETIYTAYQDSYRVARDAPETYARMSERAIEKLRGFCSKAVVRKQLAEFFRLQTTDRPIDMNILQTECDKK